MKRSFLSSLVCLLYLSVALVVGVIHNHHPRVYRPGRSNDCAACQWQLLAKTDVPLSAVAPVVPGVVVLPSRLIQASEPAESPFCSATASRAPPRA
jgi:hypothetical protein